MLNQKLTGQQAADKTYIEDVFSTYLYTGNGSTQTINNGIDLAGKGGMVWIKSRSGVYNNVLFDTTRGTNNFLVSNTTAAAATTTLSVESFNNNGFSINGRATVGESGTTYASWTFRKAPKFFDVVTYTGNGVQGRQISHSLGVAPGMVIVKRTNTTGNWITLHRSLPTNYVLQLNYTSAQINVGSPNAYVSLPTSTDFTVGSDTDVNASGSTYVAYLFAHDTTTDGLIQCGSFTTDANATVTLGWEPQYVMVKRVDDASNWMIFDAMRGLPTGGNDPVLYANTAGLETTSLDWINLSPTGFTLPTATWGTGNSTWIYMAIRRGPMRTPTDGTKVFSGNTVSATTAGQVLTTGFPVDLSILKQRTNAGNSWFWFDRLRSDNYLSSNATTAETSADYIDLDYNTGIESVIGIGSTPMYWNFRRAPGFFDVVCYTGDSATSHTIKHNLKAVPELMIVKSRSSAVDWCVYNKTNGSSSYLLLNTTAALASSSAVWAATTPTDTSFYVGQAGYTNNVSTSYVAYLFASCPGVSKVFSVTKTSGSNANVDCGFSTGARFVMLKRTDATGDWYVWDTARGIVSANDPYLLLNSTAAENTSTDYIDPLASGFTIVDGGLANGSYIGLAIA